MDPQGYAILKPSADCTMAVGEPQNWLNPKAIHIAMELNDRSQSALLINGAEMGMFEYSDLQHYFRCDRQGEILLPPGLDMFEQMLYASLATQRNGGYNEIVKKMVIMASFHKNEFNDNFIWQKGQDPDVVNQINHLKLLAKERIEKQEQVRKDADEKLRKAAEIFEKEKMQKNEK
jgi:hypothetical protein